MRSPTISDPRFNGPEYVAERDNVRLTGQIMRVFTCMRDGVWRTLDEIARETGDPHASVSAQLRHLRKVRFGEYVVNRRSRNGPLHEYQLEAPLPSEPIQESLFNVDCYRRRI